MRRVDSLEKTLMLGGIGGKQHSTCLADAIQPSHPLLPPSPLSLSLSQHQGLFYHKDVLEAVVNLLRTQRWPGHASDETRHLAN